MPTVTLKDVAALAEVNVSTASRALSPDKSSLVRASTRDRVLRAAQELGYRGNLQASALRRGRTGTVGVVVADLSNPFIGPVLRGIASALGHRDLLPIMTESRDSSEALSKICNKLLAQRVDGLIVTAGRYRDRTLLKAVAVEVPTVLAVRDIPRSGIPVVCHDDLAGGRLAAEHLLTLGHRKFAQLVGPRDVSSFAGRAEGFRAAIAAAGGRCLDIEGASVLPTVEAGRSGAAQFLDRNEGATAMFAHNDSMAIGAIAEFRQHGLQVPRDISVVGFNDVPLTDQLRPPLTTVRLPGYELGRLAADLLLSRGEGSESTAERVVLAPELVIRDTTKQMT